MHNPKVLFLLHARQRCKPTGQQCRPAFVADVDEEGDPEASLHTVPHHSSNAISDDGFTNVATAQYSCMLNAKLQEHVQQSVQSDIKGSKSQRETDCGHPLVPFASNIRLFMLGYNIIFSL